MDMEIRLNVCKWCLKQYSRSETIRADGDMWWTGIYCSAQCHTYAVKDGRVDNNGAKK